MSEAEPRGSLVKGGKAYTMKQLAALARAPVDEVEKLIEELETEGVFSRDPDGTIYSRRIRRDIEREARDKTNGGKGGNPSLKPRSNQGVNPSVNPEVNGEDKAQKPEARSQSPEARSSLRSDGASDAIYDRFLEAYPKRAEEDGVRRELGRLIAEGVPIEEIVAGAIRYRAECAKRGPEHIASPVRWLRDGRWKDGKPRSEKTLPIVEQRSAQGQAWDAHAIRTTGKPLLWVNGRRTFETEWPPGYVPDGQRLELAGTAA